MVLDSIAEQIRAGEAALKAVDWLGATSHFEAVLKVEARPEAYDGLGIPGGLDAWFFETGEPAGSLTLPPPSTAPPDVEAIVASLRAYGTVTLDPPPT